MTVPVLWPRAGAHPPARMKSELSLIHVAGRPIMAAMRAPALLLLATAGIAWSGAAGAASFDCGKAATPAEKAICADPALSKADDDLAAAYKAALAATLDPASLRRAQRQWLQDRDRTDVASDYLLAYTNRITELAKQAQAWRALSRQFAAAKLASACFPNPEADDDATCSVEESGAVAGAATLSYQLQGFSEDQQRSSGAAIVFAAQADETLTPLIVDYGDTGHYGKPRVFAAAGGTFLFIPGHMEGTGDFSLDELFLQVAGVWRDVDVDTWQTALAHRLPKGLAVWKGIYPDYEKMTASTPLWSKTDGNCCPTGGRADITLRLVGTTLTIDTLKVTLGADAAGQE